MGKKDTNSVNDDFEKLKNEIMREKIHDVFRKHPKDYISKLEEIGFTFFDDDDGSEEIEEKNAKPENQRQRDLVDYFENRKKLSGKIFESYCEEKDAENPNFPLIRRYFRQANKNLKALIIYGLDNYPGRLDLLDDLIFYHEFQNILSILITYYTKACIGQQNLETFTELAQDFYFATKPDGYEAYYALQEYFGAETEKRIIIDSLIEDAEDEEDSYPFLA
jgi:hypothetical protein